MSVVSCSFNLNISIFWFQHLYCLSLHSSHEHVPVLGKKKSKKIIKGKRISYEKLDILITHNMRQDSSPGVYGCVFFLNFFHVVFLFQLRVSFQFIALRLLRTLFIKIRKPFVFISLAAFFLYSFPPFSKERFHSV